MGKASDISGGWVKSRQDGQAGAGVRVNGGGGLVNGWQFDWQNSWQNGGWKTVA
jgi:hypothetical protein